MCELLQGLDFERIPAVDGNTIDGPEERSSSEPRRYENVTRYERACILGHRLAWERFLKTDERVACVLEDDVALRPDFGKFMRDESWFPEGGHVVKIETYLQRVFLSRASDQRMGRSLAVLKSNHLGSAGYVISREGARFFLDQTLRPDWPMDRLMFGENLAGARPPIHQLLPALCIQTRHLKGADTFAEMASSILKPKPKAKKSFAMKIKNEVRRPFIQLGRAVQIITDRRQFSERRCLVKFL
jgi:glycosyl transferase family 25